MISRFFYLEIILTKKLLQLSSIENKLMQNIYLVDKSWVCVNFEAKLSESGFVKEGEEKSGVATGCAFFDLERCQNRKLSGKLPVAENRSRRHRYLSLTLDIVSNTARIVV